MANLNRIILIGRLVADPEARTTLGGLPMTKFRLAVDRPQGGADFIDIIAWQRLAEVCKEYLRKGQLVLVEGRIQIRSFDDQTGQRRWVTEVVARNMKMLEKKSQVASHESPVDKEPETRDTGLETNDKLVDDSELESDLPF